MADLDLDRARESLPAFAEMVGHPLSDWQAADLQLGAPITTLLWGRQLGKSRGLALRGLWRAFGAPGRRVLIVSGSGELGARRLLGEVRSIATGSQLLTGSISDEQGQLLTLSNRSEIRSVAASEPSIRGWQVDELYLDEAQLLSESLFGAALPTVSARPGAAVVLAGTASAASGAFYDLFRRGETGDEHVRASRRVSRLVGGPDHAPWQVPSMIEAQMTAMSSLRADAEHRCIWASDADALFTRAAVDRVTADFLINPLEELRGPARVAAGVDWAASKNRSTLVALARLPIGADRRVFGVVAAKRWRAGEQIANVCAEIAGSPAHFAAVVSEVNGLGAPSTEFLFRLMRERPLEAGGGERAPTAAWDVQVFEEMMDRRAERRRRGIEVPTPEPAPERFTTQKIALHTSSASKAATFSALRLLVDQERIVLPASAEELRRELLLLRVDLSPSGLERIEASSGDDDLADALAMSLGPYRDRAGRWRTALADLADPKRPLPEAALPVEARGIPTVATGSGLTVPRRPFLQSVAGSEVTWPDGLEVRDRDPRLERLRERVAAAINTPEPEPEEAVSG